MWGSYLAGRAQHVHDLARQTTEAAAGWTTGTCPTWATPPFHAAHQHDMQLVTRLAVWRAAHRCPDGDLRPTAPPATDPAAASAQQPLDEAVHRLLPHGPGTTSRCADLAALEPRLGSDPGFAQLVTRLDALPETVDVRALAIRALARCPLPDELPAAALWWRATRTLSAEPDPPQTPVTSPPAATVTAADRWKPLAYSIDPRLSACPAWRGFASALDRAAQAGYDVTAHLPGLANQAPLPDSYPTRSLHGRLVDECDAAVTPRPKAGGADRVAPIAPEHRVEVRRAVPSRRGPAI